MGRATAPKPKEESYEPVASDHPDLGLFSTGGPFESFPGPVLVAGRNGIVLGANAAAEGLARLLQRGGTPELRDAVNSALQGKAAQINPLLIGGDDKRSELGQAFDLVVLPWADAPAALLLARDITLERSLRAALIESRQRFKDLVDASSDFAWETDAEGRFCFVSEDGALGYAAVQLVGQPAVSFLAEEEAAQSSPFETQVPLREVDIWFRRADGEPACMRMMALPLIGADGAWHGCRGLCRDVTDERNREVTLARAHSREQAFARILRIVRDEVEPGRMLTSAANELLRVLPAAGVAILRRDDEGSFMSVACSGKSLAKAELFRVLEGLDDCEQEIELSIASMKVTLIATRYRGFCNGALSVCRPVEAQAWGEEEHFLLREIAAYLGAAIEQVARKEELEFLSTTDPLTGLLNRRSFLETVERRFARAAARGRGVSFFYIDLDNFKPVNDQEGHERGDEVLKEFGALLRDYIRDDDLAGRLGGDEFALFIEDLTPAVARERGEALVVAAKPMERHSPEAAPKLGISIGVASFEPGSSEDIEALMARADGAMYVVKRRGKHGCELAAPADDSGEA